MSGNNNQTNHNVPKDREEKALIDHSLQPNSEVEVIEQEDQKIQYRSNQPTFLNSSTRAQHDQSIYHTNQVRQINISNHPYASYFNQSINENQNKTSRHSRSLSIPAVELPQPQNTYFSGSFPKRITNQGSSFNDNSQRAHVSDTSPRLRISQNPTPSNSLKQEDLSCVASKPQPIKPAPTADDVIQEQLNRVANRYRGRHNFSFANGTQQLTTTRQSQTNEMASTAETILQEYKRNLASKPRNSQTDLSITRMEMLLLSGMPSSSQRGQATPSAISEPQSQKISIKNEPVLSTVDTFPRQANDEEVDDISDFTDDELQINNQYLKRPLKTKRDEVIMIDSSNDETTRAKRYKQELTPKKQVSSILKNPHITQVTPLILKHNSPKKVSFGVVSTRVQSKSKDMTKDKEERKRRKEEILKKPEHLLTSKEIVELISSDYSEEEKIIPKVSEDEISDFSDLDPPRLSEESEDPIEFDPNEPIHVLMPEADPHIELSIKETQWMSEFISEEIESIPVLMPGSHYSTIPPMPVLDFEPKPKGRVKRFLEIFNSLRSNIDKFHYSVYSNRLNFENEAIQVKVLPYSDPLPDYPHQIPSMLSLPCEVTQSFMKPEKRWVNGKYLPPLRPLAKGDVVTVTFLINIDEDCPSGEDRRKRAQVQASRLLPNSKVRIFKHLFELPSKVEFLAKKFNITPVASLMTHKFISETPTPSNSFEL